MNIEQFKNKTTQKEKVYGTDYNIYEFTENQINLWKECLAGKKEEFLIGLSLPQPNYFIPTEFDLKDEIVISTFPSNILQENKRMRVFCHFRNFLFFTAIPLVEPLISHTFITEIVLTNRIVSHFLFV